MRDNRENLIARIIENETHTYWEWVDAGWSHCAPTVSAPSDFDDADIDELREIVDESTTPFLKDEREHMVEAISTQHPEYKPKEELEELSRTELTRIYRELRIIPY